MALATPDWIAPTMKATSLRVIMRCATRVAGRRRRLGVGGDVGDLAAEHAALGVVLVDRHDRAAHLVLARIRELAAGVVRQADQDRLVGLLRPDMVVLPRPEEGRAAGGERRRLQEAAPRDQSLFHVVPPVGFVGRRVCCDR